MNKAQQKRYESLYQDHLNALQRQGKSKATIDAYSRAVRRISGWFNRCPDKLTTRDLKDYFTALVNSHSWSTVKIDRNGLQFFYKHVLNKQWHWVDIVKPPQVKSLPDILTANEISLIINSTREARYQTYILVVYSMGLRLSEALNLKIGDIDAGNHRVHIRHGKGRKDRFVTLPDLTLTVMRRYWSTHRHASFIFPGGKTSEQRQDATAHMERGGCQNSFKVIVRSCKIHKHVSIHSLRHCYATHLVEAGCHLRAIQKELGHESPKTTAIYTQLTKPTEQNTTAMINTMVARLSLNFVEGA